MKETALQEYIHDHAFYTIVALLKLCISNENDKGALVNDVWLSFHKMYRLNETNSLPSSEFIYIASVESNEQNMIHALLFSIHDVMLSNISYTVPKSKHEFDFIVQNYFRWLSDELSHDELIDPQAVQLKLVEIGVIRVDEVIIYPNINL